MKIETRYNQNMWDKVKEVLREVYGNECLHSFKKKKKI